MNETLEVNSANQVLVDIYKSMPDKFDPHQWGITGEVGLGASQEYNSDSVDYDIQRVTEQKEITMFVPTPGKKTTYSVYKLENGNPFKVLNAMEFFAEKAQFHEAKEILSGNLISEGREIVVLFPNPRYARVDIYVIKKPKDLEIINPLSQVNKDVSNILNDGTPNNLGVVGHIDIGKMAERLKDFIPKRPEVTGEKDLVETIFDGNKDPVETIIDRSNEKIQKS